LPHIFALKPTTEVRSTLLLKLLLWEQGI